MTFTLSVREVFRLIAILNTYLREHSDGESAETARAILDRLNEAVK
jgi:hypothetical protein